ncbi:MAG: RHS repeat-associated core domain-containing protein [Casimicrobiaceae bacterium]
MRRGRSPIRPTRWFGNGTAHRSATRNPIRTRPGLGVFNVNHRFPGQYADVATQLSQNGQRVYDSALGRYVQSDPIGLGAGMLTYSYASGNPTRLTDANLVVGLTFFETTAGQVALACYFMGGP